MSRILVDTNILIYAAGREHPFKAAAQRVLLALADRPNDFVTNVEVFQELLHRYLHGGMQTAPGSSSTASRA